MPIGADHALLLLVVIDALTKHARRQELGFTAPPAACLRSEARQRSAPSRGSAQVATRCPWRSIGWPAEGDLPKIENALTGL